MLEMRSYIKHISTVIISVQLYDSGYYSYYQLCIKNDNISVLFDTYIHTIDMNNNGS